MDANLIGNILEKSLSVFILCVGGYFIIQYFMKQIEKKDIQQSEITNKFIELTKESNQILAVANEIHKSAIAASAANTEMIKKLYDDSSSGRFCKNFKPNI